MGDIKVSTITRSDHHVIVTCAGDLDLDAEAAFERALLEVATREPLHLELDLTGVTFFGISAIGVIVRCADRLTSSGCTVSLLGSNAVQRVLELGGVADRFPQTPGTRG